MRKEILIMLIFLAIVVISGGIIYISMSSQPNPTKIAEHGGPSSQGLTFPEPSSPMQGGQSEEATKKMLQNQIDQLQAHLKTNPNDYEILVSLGNAYYDIGDPAKSVENYEKALSIRPGDASVMVDCGAMYRQMGNSDKALEYFNKAIQTDPKLPQAYFNIGMVMRMEKGDSKAAAAAWKKYLELEPNSEAKDFLMQEIAKAEGK